MSAPGTSPQRQGPAGRDELPDGGSEPMVRPPRLRTTDSRPASRLELFFDLAYVLVVAELAAAVLKQPDLGGVLRFVGLFILIWQSWTGFTLYANRFDTDDLIFRISKFTAMLGILGCAASAGQATDTDLTAFTLSYLLGRFVLTVLYVRAWRHVAEARVTLSIYLIGNVAVTTLWAWSLIVPPPIRFWVWAAAALCDLITPLLATRAPDRAPLHVEHLPERFGLLVILVLGEVTAATVTGVHDMHWAGNSVVVAVAGFAVAAASWWVYFDVGATVSTAALRRADAETDQTDQTDVHAPSGRLVRGRQPTTEKETTDHETVRDTSPRHVSGRPAQKTVDERHDLFIYGHLPIALGVVLAGIGIEELVLHPLDAAEGGWLLTGGLGLFLLGCLIVVGGTHQSVATLWRWPGLDLIAVVAVGTALTATDVPALAVTGSLAASLAVTAARGTRKARRGVRPS